MKPSGNIKSTHDFEPYGVELEPIGDDTTNFNYKFTGQERDTFTNYDYMHFRFYASSIGRFLTPDNIIPDITNPQNWNGYSYVKGNPINFNDSSGHETPDAVQQSVKTETSANVSNPPRSTDNNNEQMKKKLTAQPKKVDVDKIIAQLVATGQVGSLRISANVQKALKNNAAFRKGFKLWLTTATGQTQFQQMSSDKNTQYVIEMGSPTNGGLAETLPSWFNQNPMDGEKVDYKKIRIILNNFWASSSDYDLLADTLGHEGFHAEDYGSGKYTMIGVAHHTQLLDSNSEYNYWKMEVYRKELDALLLTSSEEPK